MAVPEMLEYAERLRRQQSSVSANADQAPEMFFGEEVTSAEVRRLQIAASNRKSKRLFFFNGPDGSRLR